MNKNRIKLQGQLKKYMSWPIILTSLLVVMNIAVYFASRKAGAIVTMFVAIYIAIVVLLYYHNRPLVLNELISFAVQYGQVQKNLMREFLIPYALLDAQGRFMWTNDKFAELTGKDKKYRKSVTTIFPEVTLEKLPKGEKVTDIHTVYNERNYRCSLKQIPIRELFQNTELLDSEVEDDSTLYTLYVFDETEINEYIRKYEDEIMVTGLLYLDNYEEAMESVEDVRRSLLGALLDRKINQYFANVDGLVKKLEKDKYFLVMRRKSLETLKATRFSLLEEIKTVNIGNQMAVTISMGIGVNAPTYAKDAEYSRIAIELALGRGGDQVVVRDGEKISYYGGKSQAVEKNTRVKARVKAQALREFMSNSDRVVVMGHKMTDVDSFGAAIGIYRAAKTLNKRTHIVIDSITTSIRPLIDNFLHNQDYEEDMFVSCSDAEDLVNENTMVVVVDVNKPSYTECESLLHMTKTVVVLDHHRQGSEAIRNAVLSYIEPYASSACEMVAEILQYFVDGVRIRNIEADSIYAGIMVDTDNFLQKTGVRTFEAAAFLRRCGADVTRVRKMFRENMKDYQARGETISNAELFRGCFAISVCPSGGLASPTIVGAQAANELLNIVGVKASFVLTDYKNKIYISARAIDEVNVQIVMERLGGGGHMNIAGAQMEGKSMDEVKRILKDLLAEMMDGGEI